MYICSYGRRSDGLSICLSSVMVSLMVSYSYLLLEISNFSKRSDLETFTRKQCPDS